MATISTPPVAAAAIAGRQSGAGMIEVLIAIVITAFALLGLAGLQAAALRYQKVAHFRTLATQLSSDLADRVRGNVKGARNGAYSPAFERYPSTPAAPSAAPSCADPGACTPAEVAAIDIRDWRAELSRTMAGGWGEISGSIADGFVIRVYFKERDIPASDKNDCRPAALSAVDKDVRCFATVFMP
ncbi:type IV pilus modification protein PilV [Paraherbaspirillum soli]|uniref:Type IV pilus modification protein PilV n=1 Tax=Paraherbaspirillum soli TaxID=631222 RepID=A0ABW0M5H2_9BURK